MTSALSDYDALALRASWECIEALRDLYCIACIQQMQNKHQAKSSSMLQSQAKPSNLLQSQAADFEKDADGPGCRGSPYVATASVQTAPSSTKLRSLASAQRRSRTLHAAVGKMCTMCSATTIKTSSTGWKMPECRKTGVGEVRQIQRVGYWLSSTS